MSVIYFTQALGAHCILYPPDETQVWNLAREVRANPHQRSGEIREEFMGWTLQQLTNNGIVSAP